MPGISGSVNYHAGVPFRLSKLFSFQASIPANVQHTTCGGYGWTILAHFQATRTAGSIQPLSLPADLSRIYVNMIANVVYDSLHYKTHGEGEDPIVSSPTEPVGRRRDPMGHLPFWQEPVAGVSTRGYENLSGNQIPHSP